MKITWFTLPMFLAAAMACADGSRVTAVLNGIRPQSQIEEMVHSYKRGAAITALLAAGMHSMSRTGPANLCRSMWGG